MSVSLYGALLLVRLLFVLSPSYVHPDEFHQSGEVVANAMLRVDARPPWEFTTRHDWRRRSDNTSDVWCESGPFRGALTPLATSGVAFALLASVERWLPFGIALARPATLVVAPRLVMYLLSLLVDASVLVVSERLAVQPLDALLVVASSHVMLVFHTRTFSNAVESALLAIVLSLAALAPLLANVGGGTDDDDDEDDDNNNNDNNNDDIDYSEARRRNQQDDDDKYAKVGATFKRRQLRRVRAVCRGVRRFVQRCTRVALASSGSLLHAAMFGLSLAVGLWNRFTFVAFAAPSAAFVLLCLYRRAAHTPRLALLSLLALIVSACSTVVALALIDELWFGSRQLALWSSEPGTAPMHLTVNQ